MAKQMVFFNATKQIETITIHYNDKLDGAFVDDVASKVKEIAKKMKGVDLKTPKEYESIKVFVYPSKALFYKVFAGEIEKRFYSRKRSLEDLYVVQDAGGNIHIVSPRGMASEKRDAFKKILVMKILGQYMDEKQKQNAQTLLKQAMKPKEDEKEKAGKDDKEVEEQPELEDNLEQQTEIDQDEPIEELESDEGLQSEIEEAEQDSQQPLDDAELEEIIETELAMEQIDEKQEQNQFISEQPSAIDEKQVKQAKCSDAQEWLSAGWFAYIRGKLKREQDIKKFANNISKKGVKKLGQLSKSKWYQEYNYSEEYACAWVECIISTYGMKKFLEYYESPKDIKRIFGIPKFVFESQVKAYIKEKYKNNQKVLNITEDTQMEQIIGDEKQEVEKAQPISKITALHFSKNGGVDIISEKEIAEPAEKEILFN